MATHLAGKDARYEAVPFKMANGHRFLPDWAVYEDGELRELHEVKGSYRLPSHGRALLAFDQCRIEFPQYKWVWHAEAKKKKAKPCVATE